MTKYHPVPRMISVGLVLLTLVASLVVTTRMASVSHAANPSTHVPLTQYGQFPVSVVGRLTVSFPRLIKDCTATVLVSADESVVDTAAHCFFNGNTIAKAKNVQFCPQYYDGQSPLGCWTGTKLFVASKYTGGITTTLDAIDDYGFLVVSPQKGRGTLESAVGGVSPAPVTTTAKKEVTIYGYPSNSPYMPNQMYSVTGESQSFSELGFFFQRLDTDMGRGASGGPWFSTINGSTYLVGHSTQSGAGQTAYSPEIPTNAWTTLFNQVQQIKSSCCS